MTKFEEALQTDVSGKTEKKGNLTYLSWAWAWAEFKKIYPDATYEVKKFNGLPYVHDGDTGYIVYTSVTADGITYEMWLPVMDARNKTLMNATMFDINKTIMRCLTKNLAMFGLGLYIYAGEDLPEGAETSQKAPQAAKAKPAGKPSDTPAAQQNGKSEAVERVGKQVDAEVEKKRLLRAALDRKIILKGMERRLAELQPETLQALADRAQDKSLRDDMLRVMQYKFTLRMKEEAREHPDDLPFPEEA